LLLSEEILRGYTDFKHHGIMEYPSDQAPAGRARLDRRSGQMIIFTTLTLFLLFSVMGLAVDLGYSYYVKISAQNAADAAAAGAMGYANIHGTTCGTNITCGAAYNCPADVGTVDNALKAGCAYAKSNGYTDGVTLIANNTTPTYAPGVNTSLWIQANVAQTVTHPFLYWAGFRSGSVESQATSGMTTAPNSSCIYVLDSSNKAGALSVTGAAILTATDCGVYVNSSSSTAINVTGSAQLITSQSSVVGNYSCSWSTVCNPAPTTGAAVVTDPLANRITAPSVPATCTHTNYQASHVDVATLSADGVYCGGISAIGSAHVTLNAGTYILKNGGFSTGNSAIIDANGPVTIFMTAPGGTNAAVVISGASRVTLSAPTSGSYKGILFYQDPDHPGTTTSSVGNSASLTATGTWYMPKGVVSMSGAISTGKMALVVKDLTVANSATFQQDLTGAYTGLAQPTPTLIQ
jgi:Flp pilus assembly protein TadG